MRAHFDTVRAVVHSLLVLGAAGATPACAMAQSTPAHADPPPVTRAVVLDHRTRALTYNGDKVSDRDVVRTRRATPIRITNSNSAFYSCAVEATATPMPEVAALQTFGALVGGTLPALLMATAAVEKEGLIATTWISDLDILRNLLIGSNGLAWIRRQVLEAIDEMGALETAGNGGVSARARTLRLALINANACDEQAGCVRLNLLTALRGAFDRLELSLIAAENDVRRSSAGGARDAAETELKLLREVMETRDRIMALAQHTSRLAALVANASDTITCETVHVPATEGRKVDLAVKARPEPELAAVALRKPYAASLTMYRDWLARPAASISFLYTGNRTFDTYGVRTVGDTMTVGRVGSTNPRAHLGVTLGLAWRGLDGRDNRDDRFPLTFWLPEVTVDPTGDGRAIGAGVAITALRIVKVGTGLLWTRRTVLDGQSPGDVLAAETDLRTKVVYENGRNTLWRGIYLSVSITGFAPFVAKAP